MIHDHDLRVNGQPAAPDFSVPPSSPMLLLHIPLIRTHTTARIPRLPFHRSPQQRLLHFPMGRPAARHTQPDRTGWLQQQSVPGDIRPSVRCVLIRARRRAPQKDVYECMGGK